MSNLSLYIYTGSSAPTTVPANGTPWARCKSPGSGYTSTDRNPTHWTADADYWFSWSGLTYVPGNNTYCVPVGRSDRDIIINPQSANYTAFSIGAENDVLILEYNYVAAGTPGSVNYSRTPVGQSGSWKITESSHQDGSSGNTPFEGDHFYVFATIPTNPATVVMCDPFIRNDQN